MDPKPLRLLLALLLTLGLFPRAHAATEQWIRSAKGASISTGAKLAVHDPEANYVFATPLYTQRFTYSSAQAVVILRFDDTQRDAFTSDWNMDVTYTATTRGIDGTVQVFTDQHLIINYTVAGGAYTDIAERVYDNALWANIKVTGVSSTLPVPYPDDIFLDLRLDIGRRYVLGPQERPSYEQAVIDPADPTKLQLDWGFVEGAESYDLEWVFVDIGQGATSGQYRYDFANATRINTAHTHYDIPLVYPRGLIIWRFRGVGLDDNGKRLEGPWHSPPSPGLSDQMPLPVTHMRAINASPQGTAMNWQYTGSYAENGKRKDLLTFFDGGLKARQSITLLNTEHYSLIDHKVYDFLGRPSLQLLPYPTLGQDLRFRTGQSTGFGIEDFDTDAAIATPAPFPGVGPGHYYSAANTGMGTHGELAPDAQGFPFSRTVFMNDGSGRVREQAGPGPDHRLGSGHTTRYTYGAPGSQFELDRLFGNEVGIYTHYKKDLVTDPNGVISVTYTDPLGRTVATALAHTTGTSPLLPVDGYDDTSVNVNGPIVSSYNSDHSAWSTAQVFTAPSAITATFTYGLDAATEEGCINAPCVYDLDIRILDDCGSPVLLSTGNTYIHYNDLTQLAEVTFSASLQPGAYTIQKSLTLDQSVTQGYFDAFFAHQPPCIDLVEPEPVPCDQTCEDICEEAHRTTIDGIDWYTDDNGVAICPWLGQTGYDANASQAVRDAIEDCKLLCIPTLPSLCEVRRERMLTDMTPGGQYFDNLPHEGEENYDINGWLSTHVSANSITAWQYSTWTAARANYTTAWEQELLEAHPEYAAYEFYCLAPCGKATEELFVATPLQGDGTYHQAMYAQDNVPLNDPDLKYLWNPLGAAYVASGPQYQPISPSLPGDEHVQCLMIDADAPGDCLAARTAIGNGLTNFFPIDPTDLTQGYYSIWNVIEDPGHIAESDPYHTGTYPAAVQTFFNTLHGGANSTPPALISSAPGPQQIYPYQFFRGVYDFYRELYTYTIFQNGCTDGTMSASGFLDSPDNDGRTADGFSIVFPHNTVYDNFPDFLTDPTYFTSYSTGSFASDLCEDQCEQAADDWMQQVQGCLNTGVDPDCVRDALIAVCKLGCDAGHPMGNTEGNGSLVNGCTEGTTTPQFTTFQEVLAHYGSGCTTPEIPTPPDPNAPAPDPAVCHCERITTFITQQLGHPTPADAAEQELIISALEELEMTGDDYTTPLTWSTVAAWIAECNSTDPSEGDLFNAHLAHALRCTELNTTTQDCNTAAQIAADYAAAQINSQLLANAANAFLAAYRSTCMDDIAQREHFTIAYPLNEYHYTLYYYDQAGNLVKTVPPAGVNLRLSDDYANDANTTISFADDEALVAATTAYRQGTPNAPYVRPRHSMVSWYTFNSFQQPVKAHSPDGGTTTYFYDRLGRVVASQDPIQAEAANHVYTYSLYDDLGRITETGQMTTQAPDALDAEVARGANEDYPGGFQEGAGLIGQDYFGTQLTQLDQVTRTYYTNTLAEEATTQGASLTTITTLTTITSAFGTDGQTHLRNRVVASTYKEHPTTITPAMDDYDQATHYSYDIHGNVGHLVQEIRELQAMGQSFKRIDYDYDLLSGNVHAVHYQPGQWDEFHHRYRYDADNRLREVRTSRDGHIWQRDARYFYYALGPLARTELGAKQVQGIDHYYTLQGWLKGVNSIPLSPTTDPGRDGFTDNAQPNNSGPDRNFATDAYAFALNYYPGDFHPVATSTALPTPAASSYSTALTSGALYNGNIPGMLTALQQLDGTPMDLNASVYTYDKLNRLREHNVFLGSANTTLSGLANTGAYRNVFHYDANGNIVSQLRNGSPGSLAMDDLRYRYYTADNTTEYDALGNTPPTDRINRLARVLDNATTSTYTDDLEGQDNGNYTYDKKGRLTADGAEGLASLEWNQMEKLTAVRKDPAVQAAGADLEFHYGPMGHRTIKREKPRASGTLLPEGNWEAEYYIRDAQGEPMAIYRRTYTPVSGNTFTDALAQAETYAYGSARLGAWNSARAYTRTLTSGGYTTTGGEQHFTSPAYTGTAPATAHFAAYPHATAFTRGEQTFEESNHLGNVLSTLSDRRIQVLSGSTVDHYRPDERSVADYSAFGALLAQRHSASASARFGFQDQESDKEINGESNSYAFEFRMHDPRIGRFLSTDPLAKKYVYNSPYAFSENRVIDSRELEGLERTPAVSGNEHEGDRKTTREMKLCKDCPDLENVYEWIYHEGGVDGSEAGWMLQEDYAEDVIKPLAKDYIAWQDEGYSAGHMWPGFSASRSNSATMDWGSIVSDAADYQRANPTYDGWMSYIPIWGAANQAYLDYSVGKYGWGTFNSVLAITDVFLVKSIFTGVAKGGIGALAKGSASWEGRGGYRAFYGESGFAAKGQDVHHWLIPRNGWGKSAPNWLKNQMWNLMPFESRSLHFRAGHGWNYLGETGFGIGGRLWYGTPLWPKLTIGSYGGRQFENQIRLHL